MSNVKPSTALGRQLGSELRRLRQSAGYTTEAAAGLLDCTKGKISRMENGHVPVRSPDLSALMDAFGVSEATERDRLRALARSTNRRKRDAWWQEHESLLSDAERDQFELEAGCQIIRLYQAHLVPDLLQTAAYARAVTTASLVPRTPEETEEFVRLRLRRQERLSAPQPPRLRAVLSEAVVRQRIGGPRVMAEQLRHLVALSGLDNVTLHVLPFTHGAHASLFGPYVLMSMPRVAARDVVVTETPLGPVWVEKEGDIGRYQTLFSDACEGALPSRDSVALFGQLATELEELAEREGFAEREGAEEYAGPGGEGRGVERPGAERPGTAGPRTDRPGVDRPGADRPGATGAPTGRGPAANRGTLRLMRGRTDVLPVPRRSPGPAPGGEQRQVPMPNPAPEPSPGSTPEGPGAEQLVVDTSYLD